jgi:hypothetical protein
MAVRLEKALPSRRKKIKASSEEGHGRGEFDGGRYEGLAKFE